MTLAAFVGITVLGFLLWVPGLTLVWLILRTIGISFGLWAMIEALSTAVAAAAVLGGGFVAYRELSEIANTRYMEVADRLFKELNAPEQVAARRWVFQNLPDDPREGIAGLTPEAQAAVKLVLNSLDRVAFLTQAGWIPCATIMPWMHPMIAKSWSKLDPYVKYEQKRRNEPYYYEHAARLADRCRDWRADNLSEAEIVWLDDAL
jgi:hypothetical protein